MIMTLATLLHVGLKESMFKFWVFVKQIVEFENITIIISILFLLL